MSPGCSKAFWKYANATFQVDHLSLGQHWHFSIQVHLELLDSEVYLEVQARPELPLAVPVNSGMAAAGID